ncbi:hypothetical protein WJX84_007772 [Apatococcus fuscideae]|uniref:Uncharacterized protein n=1 Tax=Apatococcus fuscideae TaxID=2026836 RepID=A0AAW1T194_9CHLO
MGGFAFHTPRGPEGPYPPKGPGALPRAWRCPGGYPPAPPQTHRPHNSSADAGGHDDWQSLGPDIVHDALQPVRPQSDDECPEQCLPGLPTPVPTRRRRIRTDHVNQDAHHSPAHEGTCLHGVSAAHQSNGIAANSKGFAGFMMRFIPSSYE